MTGAARPQADLEVLLAGIWREVLGRHEVAFDEGFFDAGGDSRSLAAVGARLTVLTGLQVDLPTLFEHPTIHALAAHLAGSTRPTAERSSDQLVRGRGRLARRRAANLPRRGEPDQT